MKQKKGFERHYPNDRARQLADEAAAKLAENPGAVFLHVCAKWLETYEEAAGLYK